MRRPTGILVLALLMGFAALVIPVGLWMMPGETTMFVGGWAGALVLAVGCALAAVGLWRGLLVGWMAALVTQGVQAAINLTRAEGGQVVLALLFPAIIVGYLATREARAWCRVGSP